MLTPVEAICKVASHIHRFRVRVRVLLFGHLNFGHRNNGALDTFSPFSAQQ